MAAAVATALVTVACGAPAADYQHGLAPASPTTPAKRVDPRSLEFGGGSYDVGVEGTRPGQPFEVTIMTTSLSVSNRSNVGVTPVCILSYGSQVALIDTGGEVLAPHEKKMLSGKSEFLRPLDDYESDDAGCFPQLPHFISKEIRNEQHALRMGRPTNVPNLVGKSIDSTLPSFYRGLDIEIALETTPCTPERLMKLSRFINPFGTTCGGPVVVAQDPLPGTRARVGDHITITVAPKDRK
jgi:hypothetical protein